MRTQIPNRGEYHFHLGLLGFFRHEGFNGYCAVDQFLFTSLVPYNEVGGYSLRNLQATRLLIGK